MVKKKGEEEARKNRFQDTLNRVNERNPVVETKWSVEEVTPGYNTGGYYDQDIPEHFGQVSPFFNTREEAQAWMDEHEPDDGKYLAIRKHVAREMRMINWVSVRVRN